MTTDANVRRRGRGWVMAPLLIFIALAGLFAFGLTGDPSKLPSALIGRPVPQTNFPPLEGLTDNGQPVPGFHAADLAKGKVSVVNFWASWCGPCIEEHPLLITLRERSGVDIYGVNYKDQAEAGRRFIGRFGNPFTAIGTDQTGRSAIEWGVYGMPETFVINGRGEIAYKHVGPISQSSLESKLLPEIEKARTARP
ncbi:DsbE family thiol:disulfide interchange protein [Hyphomicrobium sp.]|uniref:DsbE family thiol:disulfide interchange protein n=1 Tax=Hyphomicrobium sp. TaxID=82 RepID=UPI002E2F8F98|nr:DsbE family thiol:disulfide interchange protein [Hyphomicrobium sp.]HEX2840758.1 DsbE family thiol:disulfide interchange protein [Hyphomicrobium sp.]